MGACYSDKKKKKPNFTLGSKFDKKLASLLDKEYGQESSNPSNIIQNFMDLTQNKIEDSLALPERDSKDRAQSVLKPPKKMKRKSGLKRKTKKPPEEAKTPDTRSADQKATPPPKSVITLQKVPKKKRGSREKTQPQEENQSPGLDYYEMLDNLDKSHNLVSANLDVDVMNEEFNNLKDFIYKKLELLNKKEYQMNLIKDGLQTHYSKETSTDLEMNVLKKKIDKKIKKLNSKTENLNNLNDQLYKFMSNPKAKAEAMARDGGIQKTLEQITQPDPEVHQYQRTLGRRLSGVSGGLVSPSVTYLKKTMMKRNSSIYSPSPLFVQKPKNFQPSPLLMMDLMDAMNSGMLNSGIMTKKVEKKLEEVEKDNSKLEFLTERLKKGKDEDQDQIKELITEVGEKIIGKLKRVHLEDLEKEENVYDSDGVIVWSDTEDAKQVK